MAEPANTLPDEQTAEREEVAVSAHFDTRPPQLSRWRRMQIPVIGSLVYWFLRALGPTLRFETLGGQHFERCHSAGEPVILAFWHRSIVPATWYWRRRGIVVLNTANFDGQWTRRVIERLGYGTAQGSSSRGGLKGLVVMAQRLKEGRDVAFTIDGPRGPRYVAKPGPVMLARRTGCPIVVFHCGLENAHTFEKSWDLLQVPRPFSRGVTVLAAPIRVPADASREQLEAKHAEMQAALERVRDVAETWFQRRPAERDRLRRDWNER
jgi:lysophospholipid acyltransferase (LPLAT)-like uncharacterized protein